MVNYVFEPPRNTVACVTCLAENETLDLLQGQRFFGDSNTPIADFAMKWGWVSGLEPDFERYSYIFIKDKPHQLLIVNNLDSHDLSLEHHQLQISDSLRQKLGERAEWYTNIWIKKPPCVTPPCPNVCGDILDDMQQLIDCVPPIKEAPWYFSYPR